MDLTQGSTQSVEDYDHAYTIIWAVLWNSIQKMKNNIHFGIVFDGLNNTIIQQSFEIISNFLLICVFFSLHVVHFLIFTNTTLYFFPSEKKVYLPYGPFSVLNILYILWKLLGSKKDRAGVEERGREKGRKLASVELEALTTRVLSQRAIIRRSVL